MFRYLYKFNIFYEHQYGFRPKHNTNQPFLHLISKICKNLNKSKPEFTLGIFPDLKKAGFKPGVVANTWFKFHIF